MTDRAFPRHDYFYHGIFTDCGVCGHPAQCARFCEETGNKKIDVCPACIAEGEAPDGLILEQWCSECEHAIPAEFKPESIQLFQGG